MRGYRQLAAREVQDGFYDDLAILRVQRPHLRQRHPEGVVRAQFFESPVTDGQQSALLQVRVDDTPPATQVLVDSILDELAETTREPPGPPRAVFALVVARDLGGAQIERPHRPRGYFVVSNFPEAARGAHKGGAYQ